jgi:hypothetical protein
MRRLMIGIGVGCFIASTVACGGKGTSLTGPSNSTPNVAGPYSGSMTISYPEINQTVTCPASTSITQSGAEVSIAPVQLGGQCAASGSPTLPVGNMTIDNAGSFGSTYQTVTSGSCTWQANASGGFFGRTLQASMQYVSTRCINMNIAFNLSRS